MPVFIGMAALVAALTAAPANAESGWDIFWAPLYGWAVGLSGTQTAPALDSLSGAAPDTPMPVHISFNDVVETVDLGLTTHVEARNGLWGAFFDFTTLSLNVDTPIPSHLANTTAEVALLRRFGSHDWSFELLAGLRYKLVEIDPLPLEIDGMSVDIAVDADWIDPIIGGMVTRRFGPRLMLQVKADVGGFGVGSGSDFTWTGHALVGYQLTEHWAFLAGYRILDLDYEDLDGNQQDLSAITSFDAKEDGVFFGAAVRFHKSSD